MVSITLQPIGLGLFTGSLFDLVLHSHMLFDLLQPFFRAAVSLELAEISIH